MAVALDKKALWREIDASSRAAQRRRLEELRAALRKARADRARRLEAARAYCAAERLAARERVRALRARMRVDANELAAAEREAARASCAATVGTAKGAVRAAAVELEAERQRQRESRAVERAARRTKPGAPRRSRADSRAESDDEVRANIPAELVGLFERVKRQIKGSARLSRTEAFLQYAEEHPDEWMSAIDDVTDRLLAERDAKLRAERAAADTDFPFGANVVENPGEPLKVGDVVVWDGMARRHRGRIVELRADGWAVVDRLLSQRPGARQWTSEPGSSSVRIASLRRDAASVDELGDRYTAADLYALLVRLKTTKTEAKRLEGAELDRRRSEADRLFARAAARGMSRVMSKTRVLLETLRHEDQARRDKAAAQASVEAKSAERVRAKIEGMRAARRAKVATGVAADVARAKGARSTAGGREVDWSRDLPRDFYVVIRADDARAGVSSIGVPMPIASDPRSFVALWQAVEYVGALRGLGYADRFVIRKVGEPQIVWDSAHPRDAKHLPSQAEAAHLEVAGGQLRLFRNPPRKGYLARVRERADMLGRNASIVARGLASGGQLDASELEHPALSKGGAGRAALGLVIADEQKKTKRRALPCACRVDDAYAPGTGPAKNPATLVAVDPKAGELVALGLLTRLVYLEPTGRARVLSWSLRAAPVLAYHACVDRACVSRGKLAIVERDGRFAGASSARGAREYRRSHWGDEGARAAVSGLVAIGPIAALGAVESVRYTTRKGGDGALTDYEHRMGEGGRGRFVAPLLGRHACGAPRCAAAGRLVLAGGSYRVTDRGIVG